MFLKLSQENACVGESLFVKVVGLQACNFIKKKTPTQVFFCEYYEIFKNTYFKKHLRTTTSEDTPTLMLSYEICEIFKNICKRLLLFVSPRNTITMSGGEFGLDETWTECILFNQMQLYNLYVN